jgi:hypothetical protein
MEVKHRSHEKVLNNFAEVKGDASFFDFSWGTGQVTEGEKSSAERGASARGTYGAKRDRCKRGKSCGAACIFYRKDCVLDLPVTVQNAVRAARKMLVDRMEKGELSDREASRVFLQTTGIGNVKDAKGRLSREQLGKAAKDVKWEGQPGKMKRVKEPLTAAQSKLRDATTKAELKQKRDDIIEAIRGSKDGAVPGLRKEIPDAKARQEKVRELMDLAVKHGYGIRDPKAKPTAEYYNGVSKAENQARIRKLADLEEQLKAGKLTKEEYNAKAFEINSSMFVKNATPSEVLFMAGAISPEARNYLMTAGKTAAANVYPERFPGRPAIPVGDEKGTGREVQRAWMMHNLKLMMDTNFKDIYSGTSYRILQQDLEHLTPETYAKQFGAANVGGNKTFALSNANQSRGNTPLSYFLRDNANGFFKGVTFGADGKVSAAALPESRAGAGQVGSLESAIKQRTQSVKGILATIAAIPASELQAKPRSQLIAKIVAEHTAASRSVTIAKTARGENSYSWFGGKYTGGWPGAKDLGNKITSAIGRWEDQGDEGSLKLMQLTGLMGRIQNSLLDINNVQVKGAPLRGQQSSDSEVAATIKREIPARMNSFQAELDALLGS